jgi:hypothetical protein
MHKNRSAVCAAEQGVRAQSSISINMKFLTFLFSLMFSTSAYAQAEVENCFYEGIYYEIPASHPICIFNVGTEMYRKGEHNKAVENWKKLVDVEVSDSGYEHIPATSNSNLGFSYFYGYGVKADKARGVKYWNTGSQLGSQESNYFLCKAYGNPFSSYSSAKKAQGHCEKAELFYIDKDDDRLKSIRTVKRWLSIQRIFSFGR